MNFIYGKNISFGTLFQYDENVITVPTKASSNIKNKDKQQKPPKTNPEIKEKSLLDQEIDSNPFFFT